MKVWTNQQLTSILTYGWSDAWYINIQKGSRDKLYRRMDSLERKMDRLEGRLDRLERIIDRLERKIDRLEKNG